MKWMANEPDRIFCTDHLCGQCGSGRQGEWIWRPTQSGRPNADEDVESRIGHARNSNPGFSCESMARRSDFEGSTIPHEDHNEMASQTLLSPRTLSHFPNLSCDGNSKPQPGGKCEYLYMDIFRPN